MAKYGTKTDGVKVFQDYNVLEGAKRRINHILDTFDHVFVSFSGGKDSLVVLKLTEEVMRERGEDPRKLKVIFRDEELIPDTVLKFVQDIYESKQYDMRYFCLQQTAHKYVLGHKEVITQWDVKREHIRPMPPYAISDPNTVYDQYSANQKCTEYLNGKICMMLGIRAAESAHRLNGIKNKVKETHVAKSSNDHIWNGRPIYDWLEKDVFKYFMDRNIPYNPTYDDQMWNKMPLRVSSTVSAESARQYAKWPTLYPVYFDQVCKLFPDILLQARYFADFDKTHEISKYEKTWNGILKYIDDHTEESQRAVARSRVIAAMRTRERKTEADPSDPFGGFPILYVFESIVDGRYKRPLIPKAALRRHYEYEGIDFPKKSGK